jgi:hypothetical protein
MRKLEIISGVGRRGGNLAVAVKGNGSIPRLAAAGRGEGRNRGILAEILCKERQARSFPDLPVYHLIHTFLRDLKKE